jgi:nitrilase
MRIDLISSSDVARVREERHNFDPTGHYGRPDIFELRVDRRRLSVASLSDDPPGRD